MTHPQISRLFYCSIPVWYFRICKNSRKGSSKLSLMEVSPKRDYSWRNIRISI